MNKPLVSIITPSYNCAHLIDETINSVLDNSYENIEYIFLDDGSEDDTVEIMAGFEYGDKRFKGYTHAHIGEQITVNQGLKKVNGKYFMIVNADDPLRLEAIETLVTCMEDNLDVLCAYCDWRLIKKDLSLLEYAMMREYNFTYMVKHHYCQPSVGSMFRSTLIKTIGYRNTSYRWLGDFDYWLKIGLAGQMKRVPQELAFWRHRNGQLSEIKSEARAHEHIRIMQEFYSRPNIPLNLLKVRHEAICWSFMAAAVVTDRKVKTIYYLMKAFLSYPFLVINLEFWDTIRKRALLILQRR